MNVRMWLHAATRRNVATLRGDGVTVMELDEGEMACGEYGPGRLPEPDAILAAIADALAHAPATASLRGQPDFAPSRHRPLYGRRILITAGPTHEPIDPVRYIANRRSEEHTSELQSLMRISYAVFRLKKKSDIHTSK